MRKIIGGIAVIVVLWVGFFGWESHNFRPFIKDWLNSEQGDSLKKKVTEKGKSLIENGKEVIKEKTDSIITETINDSVLK